MKSILKELYYGNIYPQENIVSKDPDYRAKARKACEKMEQLEKKLSKGDYKRVEKMLDSYTSVYAKDSEETFIYAFKMGAKFMTEMLMDETSNAA